MMEEWENTNYRDSKDMYKNIIKKIVNTTYPNITYRNTEFKLKEARYSRVRKIK